jgi:hypothetical protein
MGEVIKYPVGYMAFEKNNKKVEYTYNLKTNKVIKSTDDKNLGTSINVIMVGYAHNGWTCVSNGKTEIEEI